LKNHQARGIHPPPDPTWAGGLLPIKVARRTHRLPNPPPPPKPRKPEHPPTQQTPNTGIENVGEQVEWFLEKDSGTGIKGVKV